MTRSLTNDSIDARCIGLPPDAATALRRYLRGKRIGSCGVPVPAARIAARLRAWLAERRAEEAAAVAWLERHGA